MEISSHEHLDNGVLLSEGLSQFVLCDACTLHAPLHEVRL
jgi:hypothetical protein